MWTCAYPCTEQSSAEYRGSEHSVTENSFCEQRSRTARSKSLFERTGGTEAGSDSLFEHTDHTGACQTGNFDRTGDTASPSRPSVGSGLDRARGSLRRRCCHRPRCRSPALAAGLIWKQPGQSPKGGFLGTVPADDSRRWGGFWEL